MFLLFVCLFAAPPPEQIGVFPYFEPELPLFEGLPPMINSEAITSPSQGKLHLLLSCIVVTPPTKLKELVV